MPRYPYTPANFDGRKFRERYNLTYDDYWAEGGFIVVREGIRLPDDPPIFEKPDAPPKTLEQRLADLEAKTANLPLPVLPLGGNPR